MDKRQYEIVNEVFQSVLSFQDNPDFILIGFRIWKAFWFGCEYAERKLAAHTTLDADSPNTANDETREWPEPVAEPGGIGLEQEPECNDCDYWEEYNDGTGWGYCHLHDYNHKSSESCPDGKRK